MINTIEELYNLIKNDSTDTYDAVWIKNTIQRIFNNYQNEINQLNGIIIYLKELNNGLDYVCEELEKPKKLITEIHKVFELQKLRNIEI